MSLTFLSDVFLPVTFAIMMVGLGTTLSLSQFRHALTHPHAVALGLLGQLVLLPAAAFLLAWGLSLSPAHAVGLVIIACSPGGIASNVVSFAVRGNVALSITLTTFSTFASLITIPTLVGLGLMLFAPSMSTAGSLSMGSTVLSLAALILIPAGIGLVVAHLVPRIGQQIEHITRFAAFPFLCVVMGIVIVTQWGILAQHFVGIALPLLLFSLIMGAIGLGLSRVGDIPADDRRTLVIEIALQNTTIALMVALTFLKEPAFILVPGCYGVMQFVATGILLWGMRKRSPQIAESTSP